MSQKVELQLWKCDIKWNNFNCEKIHRGNILQDHTVKITESTKVIVKVNDIFT